MKDLGLDVFIVDPDEENRRIDAEAMAMRAPGMRIEFGWMKRSPMKAVRMHVETDSDLIPCLFDDKEACMTVIVFTAFHPVDKHEYGLSLTLIAVTDRVPYTATLAAYHAFYEYLVEHPFGEDDGITDESSSE